MSSILVENVEQGLLVKDSKNAGSSKEFEAISAGNGVIVIREHGQSSSAGSLDVYSFQNLMYSLVENKWTGSVSAVFGESVKKVFFSNGRLVFAGSNQIDDRLGEVIYRRGMISLDEMMDAAVQVTKEQKFGQVCLDRGTFTNEDLWLALRAQIISVVKSIFMYDTIVFSLTPDVKAPTEVALWESTRNIISQCSAYGASFRYFKMKLKPETEVRISQRWKAEAKVVDGTFVSDMVSLCEEKIKFAEIETASKLLSENTVSELLELYIKGGLALSGDVDVKLAKNSAHLGQLKALLEGYELVADTVQKVYESVGKELPVDVCRSVSEKIDSQISPSIRLAESLQLTEESKGLIFSQCASSIERTRIMEENIRGLVQFVVLAAGDSLSYEKASEVKKFYKTMIQ